jgi:hypothetical protein
MALPNYQTAMMGFTTEGLTAEEATKKRLSKWNWKLGSELIGTYLDGKDLVSCCLVSHEFHDHFTPLIWSNPITVLKGKKRPTREYRIDSCGTFLADQDQLNFTDSCLGYTIPQ